MREQLAAGANRLLRQICEQDRLASFRSVVIQVQPRKAPGPTRFSYLVTACLLMDGIRGWHQIEERYDRAAQAAEVIQACLERHRSRHPEDEQWIAESRIEMAAWAGAPFDDFAIYNHASHDHGEGGLPG